MSKYFVCGVLLASVTATGAAARGDPVFLQTNLVSSVPGQAPVTDPNLKTAWGIASAPGGPFWVANQVTGTATVYDGAGRPFPVGNPLVVTVPKVGGGPGAPTGLAFNASADFQLAPGGAPARFLFATLDGAIAGWNPAVSPTSAVVAFLASDAAVYTGLALGNNGSGNFLYSADSANAKIDVFDPAFQRTALAGSFTDPTLPAGFTPYNIQNIGGTLFVTYENKGAGGGIINAFDTNGNFLRRFSSSGAGGPLDSPWGLALAPAGFGPFGGALLVGNEGNGRISAFDPGTGQFLGQLLDTQGNPLANSGLRGLSFGNGGQGGDPNTLYFAAGLRGQGEGLFGSISVVPEPSSVALFGLGALMILARRIMVPGGGRGA